jgi:hypothetical protein
MKTEKTHSPDSRSTTSAGLSFGKDSETLALGLPEYSFLRLGVWPCTEAMLIQCLSAAHDDLLTVYAQGVLLERVIGPHAAEVSRKC